MASDASPANIYCFHCREAKPVKDVSLQQTKFDSRKDKKPMSRDTWVGCCSVCGKSVRQFAKGKKEAAPSAAPAPQAASEAPKDPSLPGSSSEPPVVVQAL